MLEINLNGINKGEEVIITAVADEVICVVKVEDILNDVFDQPF